MARNGALVFQVSICVAVASKQGKGAGLGKESLCVCVCVGRGVGSVSFYRPHGSLQSSVEKPQPTCLVSLSREQSKSSWVVVGGKNLYAALKSSISEAHCGPQAIAAIDTHKLFLSKWCEWI